MPTPTHLSDPPLGDTLKLKNTLLALSAATVIATAGAGVASAETTTTETTTATAEGDSIFGSSSKADETEGTTSGSSDDFFGWDESTTGAQKFEDVSGIVGKVFGFIGKIVKIFL